MTNAQAPGALTTGEQVKAARKLLGWAAWRLAEMAKIKPTRLDAVENYGVDRLNAADLVRLQSVLEGAGVEFTTDEAGVRLKGKGSLG